MSTRLRTALGCLALATAVLLSGCGVDGLNSYPLPFTAGGGDRITVEVENSVTLVPNSAVKVDNVTVGSVRKIEFEDWHAVLTVSLNEGVTLPANAVARIGQQSLLGARFLQLAPPPNRPARGRLAGGDVIPLDRAGRYPETEEVLSALSLVLNGGGLRQVKTITTELNQLLGGREADVRALLSRLDRFTGAVDAQRSDLVRAIDNFDRLAAGLAERNQTLATAIETIPPGLAVLNREEDDLVRALRTVSRFGQVATRVIDRTRPDLIANLRALAPALREIADAGPALPESLGLLLFPFPLKGIKQTFRGDYINASGTLDLTAETLAKFYAPQAPALGALSGPAGSRLPDPAAPDQAAPPLPELPELPALSPLSGGER